MTSARMSTLARLRGTIERIETHSDTYAPARVSLGHAEADAALQGGLARGTVHEVFAEGRHSAAATGFIAGLAHRVSGRRPLLWIRQDFVERECGTLAMNGWRELGLDPRLMVTVRAPDVEAALRTAADALACDALGSVVLETWGDSKQFDLVASRKLTLAARGSGVTALLLRTAATPLASTAETRWIVRSAHSPPARTWELKYSEGWGAPMLNVQLVRNRHGLGGQWIMEWKCDDCEFRDRPTVSQPVAAAIADRSHQAAIGPQRRAG
ncbi:MAG: DNA repair protein [Bradyrhizobiaceae bacterium]|nr:MAG: DNA repair protein [Bradyrhizobiaceae bacterium]